MKKTFLTLFFIIFLASFAFAAGPLEKCFKTYNSNSEDVYLKAFTSLSVNKYEVLEIQSDSGYILFKANGKDYLLTVVPNGNGSLVKVMPTDTDFSKGFIVEENVFKMLDSVLIKP